MGFPYGNVTFNSYFLLTFLNLNVVHSIHFLCPGNYVSCHQENCLNLKEITYLVYNFYHFPGKELNFFPGDTSHFFVQKLGPFNRLGVRFTRNNNNNNNNNNNKAVNKFAPTFIKCAYEQTRTLFCGDQSPPRPPFS